MQEREGRHMRSIISKEKIKKKNERVYKKVMERVEKESKECWKKNVMRVQRLRENQFERKREGKYNYLPRRSYFLTLQCFSVFFSIP
jgi:hypothetical protein